MTSSISSAQKRIPFEPTDVTAPEFRANPFPTFKRWRETRPVVPVKALGERAWLITRYDDVQAALKDERLVKDRENAKDPNAKSRQMWVPPFVKPLTHNMLDSDVPDHSRLRSLVHQAFMPRLIGQMQSRIHDLSHRLIDQAQAKGSLDLIHDFALQIPMTIISEMLGVQPKDRANFHTWSNAMVNVRKPSDGIFAMPSLYRLVQFLRGLFREHLLNPQDNLTTALLKAEQDGSKLSEDELVGMVALLLSAGQETVVNLIGNGVLALLQNPEQLERLKTQPEVIKPAVEELMRYTPPVMFSSPRFAGQDLEIAGTQIPRGDLVLCALASANHDPSQFENPETLQLERSNNKHLGFGMGIHYCLGAPLARLEASIAFRVLFERLPHLRLAIPAQELKWTSSLVPRGLKSMPMLF